MQNALLLFFCFGILGCKNTPEENQKTNSPTTERKLTTAETIAYHYGFEHWNEVEEIQFTFNVDRGENHFERTFHWKPMNHEVTYLTAIDTISYLRTQALDSIQTAADQRFINDKDWLLAPFQLLWDRGTVFSEGKNEIAPISKDTLNRLTITYGPEGGYTPGDAYDLYYNPDFEIKEWVYREGNSPDPTISYTWENLQEFHNIKLCTMHQDSTKNTKIYFTNLLIR